MFVLVSTLRIMVVKFVCACFIATRSYVVINSVSEIYSVARVCGITIASVT